MEYVSFSAYQERSSRAWIRRSLYLVFGSLFLFEILNYTQVLSFKVDFTWLGRVSSTLILFALLRGLDELLRRKMSVRLRGTVWILMAVLLLVDFTGDVFGFYGRWMQYDQVVHFLSGPFLVASLVLTLESIMPRVAWQVPKGFLYLQALGMSTIFAVLYEIEEYLEDYFYHTNRLGDGPDTANDLMLNLLGGVLFILAYSGYRYWRRRQQLKSSHSLNPNP